MLSLVISNCSILKVRNDLCLVGLCYETFSLKSPTLPGKVVSECTTEDLTTTSESFCAPSPPILNFYPGVFH